MDRSQPASSNLMETHNRLIAAILTHYRALMMLATAQAAAALDDGGGGGGGGGYDEENAAVTPQGMAVAGISMKMEFDGLYASVKDLFTLSRKIKQLWVFGGLARPDDTTNTTAATAPAAAAATTTYVDRLDGDVADVVAQLNAREAASMSSLARAYGGSWEPLSVLTPMMPSVRKEDSQPQPQPQQQQHQPQLAVGQGTGEKT